MTIERIKITSRDQWMALRANDLTASDVGAACHVSPYKTALQLYAEKTGMLMPAGDNKLMRRGRWLESAVIAAIEEEHPDWEVMRPGVYLRDTELRLGATPDALAVTDRPGFTNIQCKVVSRPAYEREWAEGPPLGYVLQALTEGLLLGAVTSYLAALVIDTYSAELELHEVPRHAGAEQRVQTTASEFWKRVAEGRPPPADFSRDAETVVALWPQSIAEPVLDLSGDNMLPGLLEQRSQLKGAVDHAMQRLLEIDTEVKDKLGAHERAELPGWRISWKTHNRKEFVTPASTYRALRVTQLTEEIA